MYISYYTYMYMYVCTVCHCVCMTVYTCKCFIHSIRSVAVSAEEEQKKAEKDSVVQLLEAEVEANMTKVYLT